MSDLNNMKYPSGLTYDESIILAEKYIEMMGGSIDTKMHYEWMAKKYFGELLRQIPMWRNVANDLLKEAK